MKIGILIIFFTFSLLISGCDGCSKSALRRNKEKITEKNVPSSKNPKNREIIKLRKENGVFFIPIVINGEHNEFVFDTGASHILISGNLAEILIKSGEISDDDYIDKITMIDANGNKTVNDLVNIKSVKIGKSEWKNVEAIISNENNVEGLLGQTVLQKFGKITFDFNNNQLIIE